MAKRIVLYLAKTHPQFTVDELQITLADLVRKRQGQGQAGAGRADIGGAIQSLSATDHSMLFLRDRLATLLSDPFPISPRTFLSGEGGWGPASCARCPPGV